MNARVLVAFRILRRLLALAAVVLLAAILAGSLAVYLVVAGQSVPLVQALSTQIGRLAAGQRTEQLTIDVDVSPRDGRLRATAALTVRSLEEGRKRFYFLLNDGLRIRNVQVGPSAASMRAAAYQLWLLTIVDVDTPVAKDGTVQLTFDYAGRPDSALFSIGSTRIDPQGILLNVDTLWYPSDLQGFFTADVSATLPRNMTLIQNAAHPSVSPRGDLQRVRWSLSRPVPGLALVAGPYTLSTKDVGDVRYQLYLPQDIQLDAERVLQSMAAVDATLTERFGPSQFKRSTVFVSRDLRRAFNDGSGVMGLSIRHFRGGDYGFATIAHEMAHAWWGDLVSENWLQPGNGGEWVVEGFAEFSSLVATEATYGPDALTRRLADEFFDPAHQRAVTSMSVFDNVLHESTARDTIYRKGAYVAMMLRRLMGDEPFFRGLQQFFEHHAFQQVTDRDLQNALQQNTEQDLEAYFADWVRSDRLADLSLDGNDQTGLTVNNLGAARIPGTIDLWTFNKDGAAPLRSTVHVGDHVPLDPNVDHVLLDPQLTWADVQRDNNRYPRRQDPVDIAVAPNGNIAVTRGERWAWVRSSITSSGSDARPTHTWEFNRGMATPAVWARDGSMLVAGYSDAEAPQPAVVTLAADGPQHTIGHASTPAPGAGGVIYAAKQDRIVRWTRDGAESTLVRRPGTVLDQPLPSPDGARLVYTAGRDNHLELRSIGIDGHGDQSVLSWDLDRMDYRWSPDGSRLYAIVGGNWDWEIWEIPLDYGSVHVLASGTAAVGDLAVSPDGHQLAFTAAPEFDYPVNRRQLYILNLADRSVRSIDVRGSDLSRLAWLDADALLVVARDLDAEQPWILPGARTLKRIRSADSSVSDFP